MRSANESQTVQPAHCRKSRPNSLGMNCSVRVRRYFLHEWKSKGCKPFGICSELAEKHDYQINENYFMDYDSCQRECMSRKFWYVYTCKCFAFNLNNYADVRCPEFNLTVESNLLVHKKNNLQGWGRKVVYECNDRYSFYPSTTEDQVRTCQKNGTWSGEDPICFSKYMW